MTNESSAEDPSIGDTLSHVTMWETLLNVIGCAASAHDIQIRNGRKETKTGDNRRRNRDKNSLLVPLVMCLTFPLVGMTALSIWSAKQRDDVSLPRSIFQQESMMEMTYNVTAMKTCDDEFVMAMSSDWCNRNTTCFVEDGHEVVEQCNVGNSETKEGRLILDYSNIRASTKHSSDAVNFAVSPNNLDTPIHPTLIKNVEVNPNYLLFYINIKIRYQGGSIATNFPIQQHSVRLKVLPRETMEAYTAEQLLDVNCPQLTCHNSPMCFQLKSYVDCHSTARFLIRFESLRSGLSTDQLQRYGQYVPRGVRFLLIRSNATFTDGSGTDTSFSQVVDWWDLTAKVPAHREKVNWVRGYFEPIYTVDLQDTVVSQQEPVESEKEGYSCNEHIAKIPKIEVCPKTQWYSENQDDHFNTEDSAWTKFLYGGCSGLLAGLGVLIPLFVPDMIRSMSNSHVAPSTPSRERVSVNHGFVTDTPSTRSNSSVQSSSDDTYETSSNIESRNDKTNKNSSILPASQTQTQLNPRKKKPSRQFGSNLKNGKTPRRGNLKSSHQNTPKGNVTDNIQTVLKEQALETNTTKSCLHLDDDVAGHLSYIKTMSFPEDSAKQHQQDVEMTKNNFSNVKEKHSNDSDVSENRTESSLYSPPTIMRIIDILHFSNPPPFPPSKVTPLMGNRTKSTQGHDLNSVDGQDEDPETNPTTNSGSINHDENNVEPVEELNEDKSKDDIGTPEKPHVQSLRRKMRSESFIGKLQTSIYQTLRPTLATCNASAMMQPYLQSTTKRAVLPRDSQSTNAKHFSDEASDNLSFKSGYTLNDLNNDNNESESPKSDNTWNRKEKKARQKKRARAESRLLRTAKKPAVHKPSTSLIPLSRAIDKPVWQFS